MHAIEIETKHQPDTIFLMIELSKPIVDGPPIMMNLNEKC